MLGSLDFDRLRRTCARCVRSFDPALQPSYVEGFWAGVYSYQSETEPPGQAGLAYFCGVLEGVSSCTGQLKGFPEQAVDS